MPYPNPSTLYEQYEGAPDEFSDWLAQQFGYSGYYDESEDWHSGGFSERFGAYIPEYDPFSDVLATQERDIETKYAGQKEELTKRASELSAEKKVLNLREEYREAADKSLETIGRLGLKSGKAFGALGRAEDLARESTQIEGKGVLLDFVGARQDKAETLASSDMEMRKDIYGNKQDWFNSVMKSMVHLSEMGTFQDAPEGTGPTITCTSDADCGMCEECTYSSYDTGGSQGGIAWASGCSPVAGYTECMEGVTPGGGGGEGGFETDCCALTSDPDACAVNPSA